MIPNPARSVTIDTSASSQTLSADLQLDQETLRKCAQVSYAEWRQATIAFVGEGRGGKTGTSNSLAGIPYSHTESTIGIVEGVTMDVKHATVQGGEDKPGPLLLIQKKSLRPCWQVLF